MAMTCNFYKYRFIATIILIVLTLPIYITRNTGIKWLGNARNDDHANATIISEAIYDSNSDSSWDRERILDLKLIHVRPLIAGSGIARPTDRLEVLLGLKVSLPCEWFDGTEGDYFWGEPVYRLGKTETNLHFEAISEGHWLSPQGERNKWIRDNPDQTVPSLDEPCQIGVRLVVADELREIPPGSVSVSWIHVLERVKKSCDTNEVNSATVGPYLLSFFHAACPSEENKSGLHFELEWISDEQPFFCEMEEFRQWTEIRTWDEERNNSIEPAKLELRSCQAETASDEHRSDDILEHGRSHRFCLVDVDDRLIAPGDLSRVDVHLPVRIKRGTWSKEILYPIPLPTSSLLPASAATGPRGALTATTINGEFSFELLGLQPALAHKDTRNRLPLYPSKDEQLALALNCLGWVSADEKSGAAWILNAADWWGVTEHGEVLQSYPGRADYEYINETFPTLLPAVDDGHGKNIPEPGQFESDFRGGAVSEMFMSPRIPADRLAKLIVQPQIAVVEEWAEVTLPLAWRNGIPMPAEVGPVSLLAAEWLPTSQRSSGVFAVTIDPSVLPEESTAFFGAIVLDLLDSDGKEYKHLGSIDYTMNWLWESHALTLFENRDAGTAKAIKSRDTDSKLAYGPWYWQVNQRHFLFPPAFLRARYPIRGKVIRPEFVLQDIPLPRSLVTPRFDAADIWTKVKHIEISSNVDSSFDATVGKPEQTEWNLEARTADVRYALHGLGTVHYWGLEPGEEMKGCFGFKLNASRPGESIAATSDAQIIMAIAERGQVLPPAADAYDYKYYTIMRRMPTNGWERKQSWLRREKHKRHHAYRGTLTRMNYPNSSQFYEKGERTGEYTTPLELRLELPSKPLPSRLTRLDLNIPAIYLAETWTEVWLPLTKTPKIPIVDLGLEPPLYHYPMITPIEIVPFEPQRRNGVFLLPNTREIRYDDPQVQKMVLRLALDPDILPASFPKHREPIDWRMAVNADILDINGNLIPARWVGLRQISDASPMENGAIPFEIHLEYPYVTEESKTLRLRIPTRGRTVSSQVSFRDLPILGLHNIFGAFVWVNARGEFYGRGIKENHWKIIRADLIEKRLPVAMESLLPRTR